MKRKSPSTGARESNAGDDFHILWASRRAIQLLNPQSDLRRIFVEKLSTVDETLEDLEKDLFLGVDVAEYFGGDTFSSAVRVDVSQLKYSTHHPEKAWTASRLSSASSGVPVIKRLTEIYKGLAQGNSRDAVIQKLRIRLISNQPADSDLQEALSAAQKALAGEPMKATTLIGKLSPEHQRPIKTLSDKADLDETEFSDFLRVLDLSGCGEASRHRQRLELIKELSPQVSSDPVTTLRSLCDLIRNEALPERGSSRGLTEHDVLAALEVSNRENLFPAPSHFQLVAQLIETSDVAELAQTIVGAEQGRKIIAHGTAGMGKTTTMQELHQHLPPGSVVLVYDCFGGGSYKIPGSQRHPQRRAFRQLTNELAVHCGTPFLLRPAHEIADLQRDFLRSLEMASQVMEMDKGGLLVIVIDAADNAVIATESDSDCFVPVLWRFPLPENCRLVMTCRTHRRAQLQAHPETIEYELKGFDEAASAAHLRTIYADADNSDCAEFHRRTGGTPRVQAYLLSRAASDPASLIPLKQLFVSKRETLEGMFFDLLESATAHSSHPASANDLLADLMCLARPVQPDILAEVHGLKPEDALNFCRSLEPGVRLENDAVWFRDEDFETFLRDQLKPEAIKAAHERLGLWFLKAPNATAYAARFVAEHLAQAGKHEELIKLAIDGPEPEAVKDEIIRLQTLRKRLSLAMQSACAIGDGFNAVRLIMLTAEAARSDGAVSAMVRANPELAVLCGNTNSARRLYLREREYGWPGAAHLRLAAIFSRYESEHERAIDHFEMGQAWIRRKFSLPENETRQWEIHPEDIAYGAEAIFWLVGAEEAFQWLNTWRPKEVVLTAATHLVRSLAARIPLDELERLIENLKLPALANAVLLAMLWRKGHRPSFEFADRTAQRIERFLRVGRKLPNLSNRYSETNAWVVSFCEALVATDIPVGRVISIFRAIGPTCIQSAPHYAVDALDHELPLRGACLIAALEGEELKVEKLMPEAPLCANIP